MDLIRQTQHHEADCDCPYCYAKSKREEMDKSMQHTGYPTNEDTTWLKNELSVMDFHRGANAIKSLIDATHHGIAKISLNPGRLAVATGGWSGCEEILSATHDTLWRLSFWDSTHRGGLEIFKENAL